MKKGKSFFANDIIYCIIKFVKITIFFDEVFNFDIEKWRKI